jgi:ATP/maltotriose-dependent transcriptional regulator MalT
MKELQKMIENDARFKFYETVLYGNLARIAEVDGNSEEWSRCNQIALKTARNHDDMIRLAYCLTEQARISYNDRVLARKYLLEALDIMDILGSTDGYATVLEHLSTLEMIRGEFTCAIENYLKVVSIREGLNLETGLPALMLSSLYNNIGEYESGLEWALMANDQFVNKPQLKPRAVMCQVWALVLLNRLSEAELLLDTVHESVLKSGYESHLGWLNFVTGLIEYTKDDATAAMSNMEESLKIFETLEGALRYRNMPLYYLAKLEVALADATTEVLPYLTILEERATSEDLPGILGQALLLKFDLALIQNDDSALRDVVQRLTTLSQEPCLSFLSPFMERLMNRL